MQQYNNYKDSGIEWIGDIPAHWEVKKFKYFFNLITHKNKKKLKKIGLENIESKTGKFIETNSQFEGEGIWFKKDDILFGKLRPYLAKVWLANFEGKAVGDFYVFRLIKQTNPRFSKYKILENSFIEIINNSTYGAKMPRVNWEFIANLKITFPPPKEQTAIANYLDRKTAAIDQLIANKKRLIELYKEEKAAVINQAVTKGINPNAPMKDSGIKWLGDIPAHWEVSRLKNICRVRQGLQISIDKRLLEFKEEALEYITIRSINNPQNSKQYILDPPKNVICTEDDILMARTGATGIPVIGVAGVFHNNFFLINFNRAKVAKMYLFYFLKSSLIYEYLLLVAGTTTVPDLNHGAFYSTPFFEFTKNEQIQIVQYIQKETQRLDAKIQEAQAVIRLYTEYRAALISEVVTGQLKVTDE